MKSLTSTRERRWATVLVLALVLLFFAAGAGLYVLGTVPFATVKVLVDSRASDGHADGFTEPLFTGIAWRARSASGVLLVYGAACWFFRRRMAVLIGGIGSALPRIGRVLLRALAGYWRSAPAWERWGFLVVLLTGLAVRLLYIQYPLRHDEAFTVEAYSRTPVHRLMTDVREPNNHLFHTLLVGLSIRLFGDAEWAVRLPALLAGWLAIAVAYAFFRRWAGGAAGLLAATLVASQSVQIEYAVLARGYSTVTLLFLIDLLLVFDWPARPHSPTRQWAFTITIALAFCTLLSSLYTTVVLCAWFLARCWELDARWRPALRALTMAILRAAGITILFYLPASIVTGPAQYFDSRFLLPSAYYYVIPRAIRLAGQIVQHWGSGWPGALFWPLAALSVAGILFHRRLFARTIPLPLLAVAVCVGLTLLQRVFHFQRSFVFLSPLFLGSAAGALVWLVTYLRAQATLPWITAGIFLTAIGGVISSRSVYYSEEIGNARDIREATSFLRTQHVNASDHVSVTLISSMPAVHYFRKAGIPVSVLETGRPAPGRLFALEDKKRPVSGDEDDPENIVMSNRDLVLRIEGFDTDLRPPPHLLWESQWSRVWLYDPPAR